MWIMSTNNRERLELGLNQEVKLRLLSANPYIGKNDYGKYYLYTVLDLGDNKEKSLFTPDYLYEEMKEKKVTVGKEFAVKKVPVQSNGKTSSKIELLPTEGQQRKQEKPPSLPKQNFRDIMLECLKDAVKIVNSVKEVPFQTNDIRSIAATLFIAKVKQWNYRESD